MGGEFKSLLYRLTYILLPFFVFVIVFVNVKVTVKVKVIVSVTLPPLRQHHVVQQVGSLE